MHVRLNWRDSSINSAYSMEVNAYGLLMIMIGMLPGSRSGLVKEDTVEVFHYYGFHLSSTFLI